MKQLYPFQLQAVKECWKALKKDDKPVLLMASVGAGKSLMLASILLTMQQAGKRALCLVNNAELVRNNCQTFIDQGGLASIYCSSLKTKDCSAPVVFGMPQSIINGIKKNEPISKIPFNIIIVDEAHCINQRNDTSLFMRILRHYKQSYAGMRLLGATGTNFRFKGESIVEVPTADSSECLFKSQVGNITTEHLIKEGFLVKPIFEIKPDLVIDFSKIKVKSNGQFNHKELETVVSKNARLTELICKQIIHIMEQQKRFGVFIFATTKKHALEILSHLPVDESALILGETPQDERTRILNEAREGKIKYLVNIAIISVGVDVPAYDSVAYLRPTESLVLLIQTLGRALRLSLSTNKQDALILDFAGNIDRHSDWDNPILLDAIKSTEKEKPHVILCPVCKMMNTEHARRCRGVTNEKRCDYYFQFKECPDDKCNAINDISVRHCRVCETEIIDPNKKLSLKTNKKDGKQIEVLTAKYRISDTNKGSFRINCSYKCKDEKGRIRNYYEGFIPSSDKARNFFYGNFIKKHLTKPSDWYMHIGTKARMELMLEEAKIPSYIVIKKEGRDYKIKSKLFEKEENENVLPTQV